MAIRCYACRRWNHRTSRTEKEISCRNCGVVNKTNREISEHNILKIPNEMLEKIFSYLNIKDWLELRRVNSKFRDYADIMAEESEYLKQKERQLYDILGTGKFKNYLRTLPEYHDMKTKYARKIFHLKVLQLTIQTKLKKHNSAYISFLKKCESFEKYRKREGQWARRSDHKDICDKK